MQGLPGVGGLPEEVVAALVRGVGAYLKATPPQELPARFRPVRSFAQKALGPHKALLLGALDDPGLRPRIAEWLNDGKHPLSKADAQILRRASGDGGDGSGENEGGAEWRTRFEVAPASDEEPSPAARLESLAKAAEREKEKARKARRDAKRTREETEALVRSEKSKAEELEARVGELEAALASSRQEAAEAREQANRAGADLARRERAWKREVEGLKERAAKDRQELKETRRSLRRAEAERAKALAVAVVEEEQPPEETEAVPEGPRRPLPYPKGLLGDDPKTLEAWLDSPDARLLVDGYNVTFAEEGFGVLELAEQRRRLVDETNKLARRKKVDATIVFDGKEVPAGVSRLQRGPVKVRYSAPDEVADDHLVALLEAWPPYPVIVVTNDRELQGRAQALGATIATSGQLLAVLR